MNRPLVWERLGNRFLTNLEGPTMKWGLDVSMYNIKAGECAGIIVAWPKTENVKVPVSQLSTKSRLYLNLFSSNGTNLRQISLDFGDILCVSVLSSETIVVISTTGIARHYVDFGLNFTQLQLDNTVQKIKPYKEGYFVWFKSPSDVGGEISSTKIAFVSNCNTGEPSFKEIGHSINTIEIVDWEVVLENEETGRLFNHVFLDNKGRVHTYDSELSNESHRIILNDAPQDGFLKISPKQDTLAVYDGNGKLTLLSSDIFEVIYASENVPQHDELYWIGSDIIAFKKNDDPGQLVVLDVSSQTKSENENMTSIYFDDDHVSFVEEIDGLRALGLHNHSILSPVLRATSDTFKLGSVLPSAILYSCVDLIETGSPRAEQTVKVLEQEKLKNAVETCITAALLEIEPKVQKRLLKAALFGKSMLRAYDSTRYLRTILLLQIGNSIRDMGDMGLFITNAEIDKLKLQNLIQRLENRKLWGEAVSLAKLIEYPIEPIYIEWACSVIQNEDDASDDQLLEKIKNQMSKINDYSRYKMAKTAIQQGRQELGLLLSEHEPVLSDRISLLMEMGMSQHTLQQAVLSCDPYLIDYVLSVLTKQLSLPQMIKMIGGNAIATERQRELISASSIIAGDDDLVSENKIHEFLNQMDLRSESVKLEFDSAVNEKDVHKKIRILQTLEKKFSSLGKKYLPQSKVCSEWADLLTLQSQLSDTYEISLCNKSAADTIYTLLKLPQLAQAQKIKGKLGISDRQFIWLRMRALVDRGDFEELWDLSQMRRPYISYQAYFNICYESGNKTEASRYVHLITEATIEEKVQMYVKCEKYDLARTMASRNTELLKLIPS